MSEERRNRQQKRDDSGSSDDKAKKILTYGVILILLAGTFIGGRYYRNQTYDSFPQCIEQKEMFGEAFHHVPYVECAIRGSSDMATECKIAAVKLFPSWQFGTEPPKGGVLSLEALSDKTGCRLP